MKEVINEVEVSLYVDKKDKKSKQLNYVVVVYMAQEVVDMVIGDLKVIDVVVTRN